MARVTEARQADYEISPDEPGFVDRLGAFGWASLFAIAVVTLVLVANF